MRDKGRCRGLTPGGRRQGHRLLRGLFVCVVSTGLVASASVADELQGVSFTDIDFGDLQTGVTSYSTTVWFDVSTTTVAATPTAENAGVSISPNDADSDADGHQISLAEGANTIVVAVTADGETDGVDFRFEVVRLGSSDNAPPGKDEVRLRGADTSSIRTGDGSWMIAGPAVLPYQGRLAIHHEGTWDPVCDDFWHLEDVVVACRQIGLEGGEALGKVHADHSGFVLDDMHCSGTENNVFDCPRGPDGMMPLGQHNCIPLEGAGVRCLPPTPDNANLAAMHLTGVEMSRFSAAVQTYAGSAVLPLDRTTVWARTAHAGAVVAITPADADETTDGHQVDVTEGANQIVVTVAAEDGTTSREYTVAVTVSGGSDASLSWLRLDGVGVADFRPETTAYTASVGHERATVQVNARAADSAATVAIGSGNGVSQTAQEDVSLSVGANLVTVTVTAEDGTTRTYMLTVTRAKSSDARLSSLSLSGLAFGAFSPDISTYSARAADDLETTNVLAEAAHEDALVSILGGPAGGPVLSRQVVLNEGVTVVSIVVTAADGIAARTYTVNVVRGSGPVLSSVAVEGDRLILTYGEPLDAASVPAPEDFSVSVDGGQVDVSTVSMSGSTLTLALESEPTHGALVTLDYSVGANPILAESGGAAAPFTGVVAVEVFISVSEASAPEGEPVEFAVRLSRAVQDAVPVGWSLLPGSASPGQDYAGQSGVLEIEAGAVEAVVSVSTTEDEASEPDETFTLQLSEPPGFPHWAMLAGTQAVGLIVDDDSSVGGDDPPPSDDEGDEDDPPPSDDEDGDGGDPPPSDDEDDPPPSDDEDDPPPSDDEDDGGDPPPSDDEDDGGDPPPSDDEDDEDDPPPSDDEDDEDGGDGDGTTGPPEAAIDVSPDCLTPLCRARTGEVVTFTDESSGTVRSWSWEFGDGGTSRSRSMGYSWSTPGFYTVSLTVSDGQYESSASLVFLVTASDPAGSCQPDAETLCLLDSRYTVSVDSWERNGEPVAAYVVPAGTNDSGLFQFFGDSNWEVLIKVLDGCSTNGNVWVFGASATDLGYAIRVADTVTGDAQEYMHAAGAPAPAIADTSAFPRGCQP